VQPDRAGLPCEALGDRVADLGGVRRAQLRAGDLLDQRVCELALVGGIVAGVEATSGSGAPSRPRKTPGPRPQAIPMSMSATSPVGDVSPS
jgi:hypothetical protein